VNRLSKLRGESLNKLRRNASVPRLLRVRLFVEVFAGSGHLAEAHAARGFHVICWDINLGAQYDLTRLPARNRLRNILPNACAVHFGLPCNTFSLARRAPKDSKMPSALRSADFPMGLPDLGANDQAKVDAGNLLLRFTVACCRLLYQKGIACTIENPQSSRVWKTGPMTRLASLGTLLTFTFCAFGTRWKKATSVLALRFPELHDLNEHRCQPTRGICSFSSCRHLHLDGVDPATKKWWSRIGQPYPKGFCEFYAKRTRLRTEHKCITATMDILRSPYLASRGVHAPPPEHGCIPRV